MRVLAVLLALAALALSVYTALEVQRLRRDVAALQAAVPSAAKPEAQTEVIVRDLMRQAKEHAERAGALSAKGDAEGARRELEKSRDLLNQAERAAGGSGLLDEVRRRAADTTRGLEDLISRVRGKPKPPPQ